MDDGDDRKVLSSAFSIRKDGQVELLTGSQKELQWGAGSRSRASPLCEGGLQSCCVTNVCE